MGKGMRIMKASSTVSSVVKGIAAGAVVGTATYMMTSGAGKKKANSHALKKNAGKALEAVGTVIENVSYMMK